MILLAAAAVAGTLADWPLDDTDGGFVSSGDTDQWQWGAVAAGPGTGFDSANAWAVGLTAAYLNDSTDALEIPMPDLEGAVYPVLVFTQWFALDEGDFAWIEVDAGNGWIQRAPLYGYPTAWGWTGTSAGWERVGVDLRGVGSTPRVRLVFAANTSGVAEGWFVDNVSVCDGDVTPPHISPLVELADTEDVSGPYAVEVVAVDDVDVASVALVWSPSGGAETVVWMEESDAGWTGTIPGQPPDTVVGYRVVASDGVNEASQPISGELEFRVYLPAPTDLQGPQERVIDDSVLLSWAPPTSVHSLLGYRVYRGDTLVAETATAEAEVPLVDGLDTFVVTALYDVGEGDPSDPVTVDASVPAVRSITPAEGYPGETLRIDVVGAYLFLAEGGVSMDFGSGVFTRAIDVANVDRARVTVVIDPDDAAPGLRDLVITTAQGDTVAPAAFTVLDAAGAPHIVDVSPAEIRQGETAVLTLHLVGELSGVPVLNFGEGLVVERVVVEDPTTLTATVSAGGGAPLGDHPITLDDGVRIYEGATLAVADVSIPTGDPCGCASGGVPAASGGVLLAVSLVRRRRR